MEWIYTLKGHVPPPVWRRVTAPYWWWYNRARHLLAMPFDRRWKRSRKSIGKYRNLHSDDRCFILGNGPSLNQTDLKRLKGRVSFGLNRIYLLFPKMGFETTYWVGINTLVIEQTAAEIRALSMPKFATWRARHWLSRDPGVVFLDTDYTPPETFSSDARSRIFEGSTVTYVALQLAYYMGFKEVVLVGVDHHFSTQGQPNVTIQSTGSDPNHFSADYFGQGFRWQLPDLQASERAYRLARSAFEADGRRIVDATLGGQLTVFPKVNFDDLF